MEVAFEKKYHELEAEHFWFESRRDMIRKLLKNHSRKMKILDIGCSAGLFLKDLKSDGFNNLLGIDVSQDAVSFCKENGLEQTYVMDAHQTDFDDKSVDLIVSSDVLEHLKDDRKALREWNRILKDNGELILFVPAFQFLWSAHDERNHHFRRYTSRDLKSKLQEAGFVIERISFWNCLLFLPIMVSRMLQNLKNSDQGDQLFKTSPRINNFFKLILKSENRFLSKFNFPLGVSVFAVCKKKV